MTQREMDYGSRNIVVSREKISVDAGRSGRRRERA
jgi:hypothetical protein